MFQGNEDIMREALFLALRGRGKVSPNPLVGAIVVKDGEIVGRGFHDGVGKSHAEVNALAEAGDHARGGTMYVTLEPCHTWGRTPPCTDAITKSGISRVLVATTDPNPSVSGKGIEQLRESGIEVEIGLLQDEAERVNESYMKFMRTGRPFITLKVAATMDGKIATRTGQSKWITEEDARSYVQNMRRDADAIVVGVGTVLKDDPALIVREGECAREPKRIVLDSKCRTPSHAKMLDGSAPTVIATAVSSPEQLKNAEMWTLEPDSSGRVSLDSFLKKAAEEEITSILVEGGAGVFSSFLNEKRIDKLMLFLAPKIIGSGVDAFGSVHTEKLEEAFGLDIADVRMLGSDILVTAHPTEESQT